jgi:hypothetical protein
MLRIQSELDKYTPVFALDGEIFQTFMTLEL